MWRALSGCILAREEDSLQLGSKPSGSASEGMGMGMAWVARVGLLQFSPEALAGSPYTPYLLSYQLFAALDYFHARGIVHGEGTLSLAPPLPLPAIGCLNGHAK